MRTTSTVSVQGHSHAMSMCEFPAARIVNCFSHGFSGSSFACACRSDSSKARLISLVERRKINGFHSRVELAFALQLCRLETPRSSARAERISVS